MDPSPFYFSPKIFNTNLYFYWLIRFIRIWIFIAKSLKLSQITLKRILIFWSVFNKKSEELNKCFLNLYLEFGRVGAQRYGRWAIFYMVHLIGVDHMGIGVDRNRSINHFLQLFREKYILKIYVIRRSEKIYFKSLPRIWEIWTKTISEMDYFLYSPLDRSGPCVKKGKLLDYLWTKSVSSEKYSTSFQGNRNYSDASSTRHFITGEQVSVPGTSSGCGNRLEE